MSTGNENCPISDGVFYRDKKYINDRFEYDIRNKISTFAGYEKRDFDDAIRAVEK